MYVEVGAKLNKRRRNPKFLVSQVACAKRHHDKDLSG